MRPYQESGEEMFTRMIQAQVAVGNYRQAEQYLDDIREGLTESTIDKIEKMIKEAENEDETETKEEMHDM